MAPEEITHNDIPAAKKVILDVLEGEGIKVTMAEYNKRGKPGYDPKKRSGFNFYDKKGKKVAEISWGRGFEYKWGGKQVEKNIAVQFFGTEGKKYKVEFDLKLAKLKQKKKAPVVRGKV